MEEASELTIPMVMIIVVVVIIPIKQLMMIMIIVLMMIIPIKQLGKRSSLDHRHRCSGFQC